MNLNNPSPQGHPPRLTRTRIAAVAGISLILMLMLFLSACSALNLDSGASNLPTLTPTATLDPSGYQAIAPQACKISDFASIQTERKLAGQMLWQQGSLIAWQPAPSGTTAGPYLAYLAPVERTSWFAGTLMLTTAPNFADHLSIAPNVLAAGDLTWSPDGNWLAFLAFRPNESLYTVMVIHPDGSGLVDLFPTDLARTDARTSQKGILGWRDDSTLQVVVSCGEECRKAYDFRVDASTGPELTPTPLDDYHTLPDALKMSRNIVEIAPKNVPKGLLSATWPLEKSLANWSKDGRLVSYVDPKGMLWVLSMPDKTNYPVDIGLRDVIETQWSADTAWLAIRAEDRIFVYETPCQSKK